MYTICKDYRKEIVIEKSRFICTLKKVHSEAEAQEFIKSIKKEFWDATHNCSAYIVDDLAQRSSDDGEPSGTAGIPMLEVLRKNGLTETAAVVTRYFGGIKLGAGGLVRAYSGSVAGAVAECGLAQKILMSRFSFLYDVNHVGRILNVLYQQDLFEIADVVYDLRAKVILKMRDEQKQEAEEWLTEHLNQKIELELEGSRPALERFVRDVPERAPKLAVIESVEAEYSDELRGFTGFEIRKSLQEAVRNTLISPDICICDDCLRELFTPSDRRCRYPFINCTNCGPRFTIIKDVPYDRIKTSMGAFPMCSTSPLPW